MSSATKELDAFYEFARQKLATETSEVTLEDALQEFRTLREWTPQTQLGQQLKQLREQFVADGGQLLTAEEVADEVREQRGRHFAEEPSCP